MAEPTPLRPSGLSVDDASKAIWGIVHVQLHQERRAMAQQLLALFRAEASPKGMVRVPLTWIESMLDEAVAWDRVSR